MISKAIAGKWSVSYFGFMVRKSDPAYIKSPDARQRATEFNTYWKSLFPGVKTNRNLMGQFLRGDSRMTMDTFFAEKITKTRSFKKYFHNWGAFTAAQRGEGLAQNVDPVMYKAYLSSFQKAYADAGVPPPSGYQKLYFKSGLAPDAFLKNLTATTAGQQSLNWQGEDLTKKEYEKTLFNQKGASPLRKKMGDAIAVQQSYLGGQTQGFRTDETNDKLTVKGI